MKILIIGSKGFIGSHVLYYFRHNNYEVTGSDVVTDYQEKEYIQIDATNSNFHSIFEYHQPDICINCSGAASVPQSIDNPSRDYFLNTVNVFKILDAIRQYQPKCKFLNISSAAVYGNPESLPIQENAILKPISPYGIHKMQAEQICKEFFNYYNIPTCSVRIFSAYGNGLKKQLFWDMYHKFLNRGNIELFGTGKETRDFIHVEDISRAIHCVITNSTFTSEVINIANGKEFTIEYVAETFRNLLQSGKKIKFNNIVRPGDPLNWKADISILKSMGYQPTIDLETGIAQYIQWTKESD